MYRTLQLLAFLLKIQSYRLLAGAEIDVDVPSAICDSARLTWRCCGRSQVHGPAIDEHVCNGPVAVEQVAANYGQVRDLSDFN